MFFLIFGAKFLPRPFEAPIIKTVFFLVGSGKMEVGAFFDILAYGAKIIKHTITIKLNAGQSRADAHFN